MVLLVVRWRQRDTLRLRDLAALFLARGLVFSHEAVRDWAARFAPLLADRRRAKRRGQAGGRWHIAGTYIKVNGTWCYRYRAIDRAGNRVEARRSAQRDMAAAQRCCTRALAVAERAPAQVTTDGHDAYPRDPRDARRRDDRGSKQRYYPLRGCGTVTSAARCCAGFAEQRRYFRPLARSGEAVALGDRRRMFQERRVTSMAALAAA